MAEVAGNEVLIVRGPVTALDDLVARLVGAAVAVRELAPVIAPLEAAFLALTQGAGESSRDQPSEERHR